MSSPSDSRGLWQNQGSSSRDPSPLSARFASRHLLRRVSRNPFDDNYVDPDEHAHLTANVSGDNSFHQSPDHSHRLSILSTNHADRSHTAARQSSSFNPFRDQEPNSNPPIPEPKSFIDEATKASDFEALQEGLNFALGSHDKHANWFPVNENKSSEDIRRHVSNTSAEADLAHAYLNDDVYTETIPLENLPSNSPLHQHPSLIDSSSTPFPFHKVDKKGPSRRAPPNLTVIPPQDLESGRLSPMTPQLAVGTPTSKFADV